MGYDPASDDLYDDLYAAGVAAGWAVSLFSAGVCESADEPLVFSGGYSYTFVDPYARARSAYAAD